MKYKAIVTLALIFFAFAALSQENKEQKMELTLISQVNQGNSYIPFQPT
jgi:hypothetical protein